MSAKSSNESGDVPSGSSSEPDSLPRETTSPESAPPSVGSADSESKKPAAGRILIGSQRDVARPTGRAPRPAQSTAVRNTELSPERVEQAIRSTAVDESVSEDTGAAPVDGPATQAQPGPADTPAPDPSPVTGDPVSAEPAELPATGSIEDELESALDDLQMDSLLGIGGSSEEIEPDTRIKGIVTRIHHDHVFVSLKGQYEGIASLRQFRTPPVEGAMLEVVVNTFREDEGLYEVSIPGAAVNVADWSDLSEGAVIDVRITGSNTGGLECNVNNIRGFIPASQIDLAHVDNFGDYINQKIQCVVTEVNPRRKRLVLSRRAVLERESQEKKRELLKTLEVGQTLDGIVTRLMDFGAFVDIGGVEGLVHVSKISWDRVSHPGDVLESGQKIRVKVEKIEADTGKIGLSLRDTQENPWDRIEQKYPVGAVVDGTVTRLAQFGAFVRLEPGIEGLVHISELAHHRVIAVRNVVSSGESVQVKILSVDPSSQKIGLSLKATQAGPKKPDRPTEDEADEPARDLAVKRRDEPLKGGRGRSSGGEQFGLNW